MYFPVTTVGNRKGAIQLSEPMVYLKKQMNRDAVSLIIAALLIMAISAFVAGLKWQQLVVRRLQNRVILTRKIGDGDFDKRITVGGNDEISQLYKEMSGMALRLREARDKLIHENEGRIEALEQLRHADRLAASGKLSSAVAHEIYDLVISDICMPKVTGMEVLED